MRFNIKVHANSSQEKIKKVSISNLDYDYEVWIKAKPVDGKANDALEKFLKREFGVKNLKVVSGFSSKIKRVEISND